MVARSMKKGTFLTAILMAGLLIAGYYYVTSQMEKQQLQDAVDAKFKVELSNVLGSVSMTMNDYTYRFVLSSVAAAASIADLTSYEEQNDDLDISLHNLYIALREEKSRAAVMSRASEIRESIALLLVDPANKRATDKLKQLAEDTFFEG
ncbi:hypothetical protein [Paenibacillus xanthanilyticus]|uniref:Chemotaxis methyl-accepting receptor HlyB-like 4HB MCP domain-containing protein n=1 Tax=Paenibacillus xanthanilyticus TaxID=1783531 RepID=A0ABV8K1L7_9BACL